ncbi:MAG: hypothetical protein ACK5MD_05110 [Flavobacteriales bacterium]
MMKNYGINILVTTLLIISCLNNKVPNHYYEYDGIIIFKPKSDICLDYGFCYVFYPIKLTDKSLKIENLLDLLSVSEGVFLCNDFSKNYEKNINFNNKNPKVKKLIFKSMNKNYSYTIEDEFYYSYGTIVVNNKIYSKKIDMSTINSFRYIYEENLKFNINFGEVYFNTLLDFNLEGIVLDIGNTPKVSKQHEQM